MKPSRLILLALVLATSATPLAQARPRPESCVAPTRQVHVQSGQRIDIWITVAEPVPPRPSWLATLLRRIREFIDASQP